MISTPSLKDFFFVLEQTCHPHNEHYVQTCVNYYRNNNYKSHILLLIEDLVSFPFKIDDIPSFHQICRNRHSISPSEISKIFSKQPKSSSICITSFIDKWKRGLIYLIKNYSNRPNLVKKWRISRLKILMKLVSRSTINLNTPSFKPTVLSNFILSLFQVKEEWNIGEIHHESKTLKTKYSRPKIYETCYNMCLYFILNFREKDVIVLYSEGDENRNGEEENHRNEEEESSASLQRSLNAQSSINQFFKPDENYCNENIKKNCETPFRVNYNPKTTTVKKCGARKRVLVTPPQTLRPSESPVY